MKNNLEIEIKSIFIVDDLSNEVNFLLVNSDCLPCVVKKTYFSSLCMKYDQRLLSSVVSSNISVLS